MIYTVKLRYSYGWSIKRQIRSVCRNTRDDRCVGICGSIGHRRCLDDAGLNNVLRSHRPIVSLGILGEANTGRRIRRRLWWRVWVGGRSEASRVCHRWDFSIASFAWSDKLLLMNDQSKLCQFLFNQSKLSCYLSLGCWDWGFEQMLDKTK